MGSQDSGDDQFGKGPRHVFACGFVAGRRVLDLEAGDGAGAALLAASAAWVTAVAASAEAARTAGERHGLPNLEWLPPDAALPGGEADVVLAPAAALGDIPRLRRLLRPGGLLIVPADGMASEPALRGHFAEVARDPSGAMLLASGQPLPADPGAAPRIAALLGELDRLSDELAEVTLRARSAGDRLEIERQRANAIESSTIWRASRPLRQFLGKYPALRRALRDGLRRLYRSRHTLRHRRSRRRRQSEFAPLVSAIVPNFNHARFLPQRLDSILGQAYPNLEVIVLDDASTDDSLAVIERYRAAHPGRIRVIANEENSGNVFRQWRRGVEAAQGELIWICESDDFVEPDFLQALVPSFLDESVMIGFGRIQFADAAGKPYPGLDAYRERAQPGIWKSRNVRPSKAWFDTGFGVHNVIANVGGCLLRAQPVEEAVWQEAARFRILGDWYLYAQLARGGRIAYEPEAVSYFRQHGENTSASSFSTPGYYQEHERLISHLRARWGVPAATVQRFTAELRAQFDRSAAGLGAMEQVFDEARVLATPRQERHVLMVILGFYLGGGEIFPINLANALVERGVTVSVLALQSEDWNPGIRARLDRRIAVYDAATVRQEGATHFLAEVGVTVIHTHFIGAEHLLLGANDVPDLPYVATMHGSYEVSAIDSVFVRHVAWNIDAWVYLTARNLDHLKFLPSAVRGSLLTRRIPNGMPPDPRPFEQGRAELGIGEEDLVFVLASRGIPEKGWAAAIEALALVQARTPRRLHLLLCGEGPEAERLRRQGAAPGVIFLGFQERVAGVYRLGDVVLLPTRFAGESFPLSLVQAMQEGRPVISTDLGEIRHMLERDGRHAGVVLAPDPDDRRFSSALADAMAAMTQEGARAAFARDSAALGETYGMEAVTTAYLEVYDAATARRARSASGGAAGD